MKQGTGRPGNKTNYLLVHTSVVFQHNMSVILELVNDTCKVAREPWAVCSCPG